MQILENYFGNYRHWPRGAVPVSVARFPPAKYAGKQFLDIAPEPWLLEGVKTGNISKEMFSKIYLKQLEALGKEYILSKLQEIGGGNDVVLLCYEAPGDFCHRHLLLNWLCT